MAVDGVTRQHARIWCQSCGQSDETPLTKRLPPEAIRAKFSQRGWQVAKNYAKCPTCLGERKRANGSDTVASNVKAMTPRELTPTEFRTVYEALMAHFDDGAGKYVKGHSDRTVAEAAKVPAAAVAGVRDKFFGPLKGHPEIDEVRAEVDNLLDRLGVLSARLDTLEKQLS